MNMPVCAADKESKTWPKVIFVAADAVGITTLQQHWWIYRCSVVDISEHRLNFLPSTDMMWMQHWLVINKMDGNAAVMKGEERTGQGRGWRDEVEKWLHLNMNITGRKSCNTGNREKEGRGKRWGQRSWPTGRRMTVGMRQSPTCKKPDLLISVLADTNFYITDSIYL